VVFKRRDRRPAWQAMLNFLWPRGGWKRAFEYVKHRVRRLPDTPEKISRGIWAGVFTAFTPFYGFHFIVAGVLAKLMRGNILAALMSTFFGNPLTYVPIGVVALTTGHWLWGRARTTPAQVVLVGHSRMPATICGVTLPRSSPPKGWIGAGWPAFTKRFSTLTLWAV